MGKTFRDWDIEQLMMFPPSVEDFVPQGHVAHFVRSTVSEALDLSAIVDCYNEERGYPPYHPVMMTALLLYAYCQGIYPLGGLRRRAGSGWISWRSPACRRPTFARSAIFASGIWQHWGSCSYRFFGFARRRGWENWGMWLLAGLSCKPTLPNTKR